MSCKEIQGLMDPYIDRELDLVRSIELERHMHDCPSCARLHEDRAALRTAIGAGSLRYRAPDTLKKSVRAALVERDRQERAPGRWRWFRLPGPAIAATAAAALLIAIWWVRPVEGALQREVVEGHIRSLMANHLTDVPSTDQHTVKPWFAGKLDFSPTVKDLTAEGFTLVGGRLDYLDNHAVAAIVYQRRQHVINVFVWPTSEGDRGARAAVRQGYNVVWFVRSGMAYWLASDLNPAELRQLAGLLIR